MGVETSYDPSKWPCELPDATKTVPARFTVHDGPPTLTREWYTTTDLTVYRCEARLRHDLWHHSPATNERHSGSLRLNQYLEED